MNISLDALRLKPALTPAEVEYLAQVAFDAASSQGVQFLFDKPRFVELLLYAVRHEVGGVGGASGFPTNIGNGNGFAGLLQNGVDVLIEGNALTKDSSYKKRRPSMWTVFPYGIHRMYTKVQARAAAVFHNSLRTMPRNIEGTATDNLVAVVSFLDTARWAFIEVTDNAKRLPSKEEVYAFHLHGYVLMTNYYRLKAGRKGMTKMTLADTVSRINQQLAGQSASAREALRNIGTA